ncbi:hypothetical protein PG994_007606 [Apiospora phragmitis]|uniref:Pantothenate kinase n=1 Tax=Apiospora phragmitis TaxID=2905665 RepID=A0ABR1UQP5_9PEZI
MPGPEAQSEAQPVADTAPADGDKAADGAKSANKHTPAAASTDSLTAFRRPRTITSTAEIDSTIGHPGSVRINVKGAYIADSGEPATPVSGSPVGSSYHETKDIRLPNHTAVVSHIAADIGGSLAKLVYFSREAHSTEPGGRLNFLSFETDRIDDCIEFMKHLKDKQFELNGSRPGELLVMATGGGAYKYYDKIRQRLGVDVLREDEMECLIIGLDFFITEIPREVFTYSETDPMHFAEPEENIYPYMLVNIGSGVSILKISGPRTYERMLDMAAQGDNSKVDMLVGDIYGTDYGKIGLKSSTIASSFGKVFRMKREAEQEAEDSGGLSNGDADHLKANQEAPSGSQPLEAPRSTSITTEEAIRNRFSSADISRSLLYAISNNIGQIAYLQSQIHGLSRIYFGGSFIRGHPQTMNTLSYAFKFWSKGQKQAYFLRHEGYLGAVGAFLKKQPRNWGRRGSFEEGESLEARLRVRVGGDGEMPGHGPEEAVI